MISFVISVISFCLSELVSQVKRGLGGTIPGCIKTRLKMFEKASFGTIYILVLFITIGLACDLTRYQQEIAESNCSAEDFLQLCQKAHECRHTSLETLSARYFNDAKNETISCTFPRILAGEFGFIECKDFATHYSCPANPSESYPRSSVCDDVGCNDCEKNTRALAAGPGFKCRSNNTFCILPQVLLYDNVADCEGGEDLCFDGSYSTLHDSCARCADGSIIPRNALCDGIIDCSDLSDECRCQNPISICDAITPILSSSPQHCLPGQVQCGNGDCIDRSKVCDGKVDCGDNQIDERSEYCGPSLLCHDLQLDTVKQECQCAELECDQCVGFSSNCSLPPVLVTTKYNASNDCLTGGRRPPPGSMRTIFCNLALDAALSGTTCNNIVECNSTAIDERDCPGKFICLGFDSKLISISERKVCDFTVDCVDGSDEVDCNDQRFYCKSNNLTFVRLNQVRNGRVDCEDGSDECVEDGNDTNSYFFHSTRQLIGNQVLYLLVWVMSLMSLTGNSVVIIRQIMKLLKLRRRINDLSSLRANHILVLNLAAADFLMGIYLLAVGIAYEKLNGSYCKAELSWRGSSVCTWMGITALISIEASVLTLVMLTTCRLYAVLQPFKTSSKPKTWFVLLLILFSWGLSALVAGIPLTEVFRSTAPDTVLIMDDPFVEQSVWDLTSGKKFLLQSLVYHPSSDPETLRELAEKVANAPTWQALDAIYKNLPEQRQQLQIAARYGYYSVHSICLADFFPRWNDPYAALSLSLIAFNFLAFIYIAAVYVAIYVLSFKNKPTCNETGDSVKMRKKIFRIIAFNFLSWIPICILSFIRLGDRNGTMVNGDVYQVAAIILLPLNSSINPVLYSDVVSIIFRKMCGYADDFKKRTIRLTSIDTSLSTAKSTLDRPK